jgi:hypothetical protein
VERLCLFIISSYFLLMLLIISVKGVTSINGDAEALTSPKWQPPKRRYASETVEHGSLNVLSAKFEVSWYDYYDESGEAQSEMTGYDLALMYTGIFLSALHPVWIHLTSYQMGMRCSHTSQAGLLHC